MVMTKQTGDYNIFVDTLHEVWGGGLNVWFQRALRFVHRGPVIKRTEFKTLLMQDDGGGGSSNYMKFIPIFSNRAIVAM